MEVDIAVTETGILNWNDYINWDRGAPSSIAIPSGYGLTLFEARGLVNPAVTAYNAYEKYICVEWTEIDEAGDVVVSGDVVDA